MKVVERQKWRWYGHVVRKGDGDIVKRAMEEPVRGKRGRGRQPTRWRDGVETKMRELGVTKEDALDRGVWRRIVAADPSPEGKG